MGVSFNPEEMVAGGFLDGQTVTWSNCHTEMFDYGGNSAFPTTPAFSVNYITEDGEEYEQKYTVGKAEDWEVNEDETGFNYIGSGSGQLSKNSNFGKLIMSLIDAGFDPELISDDVSVFEGIVTKLISIEQQQGRNQQRKPRPILLVDEVLEDAPKSGKKETKPASKKADKSEESNKDTIAEAQEVVMELLANAGGKALKVDKIPTLAFRVIAKRPNKAQLLEMLSDKTFYESGQFWEYDNKTKSIQ